MSAPDLICRDEPRRRKARSLLNGIDFVEVSDDQRTLEVHFFQNAPTDLGAGNVLITGGTRIPSVKVIDVRPCPPDQRDHEEQLHIIVESPGDFSTYTLRLVQIDSEGAPTSKPIEGFDPRYSSARFSFKASCPSDLDCQPAPQCPPPARPDPEIDYLAKDYASFRQLLLDRLAVVMPGWKERHIPDLGIALVEVLAYTGDYLSYQQDAVATEAYLATARRRISIRRHARLVDYQLHEGTNARAWIHIETDVDFAAGNALDPQSIFFISADEGVSELSKRMLGRDDLRNVPFDRYEVYEPIDRVKKIEIRQRQNRIDFHTWGDLRCCLPKGATHATLRGDPALQKGDCLLFEEVLGAETGNPADADPARRHVVRLTEATQDIDPVEQQPIVEIAWADEDALPFPLCLSAVVGPACKTVEVSVARGNLVLVDHGRTIEWESLGTVARTMFAQGCEGANCPGEVIVEAGRFQPQLELGPLVFALPLDASKAASLQLVKEPDGRAAVPSIDVSSIPPEPGGSGPLVPLDQFRDDNWEAFAATLRTSKERTHQYLRSWLGLELRTRLSEGRLDVTALREAVDELRQEWKYRADLLGSTGRDRHYAIEIDNEGRAHLRFGDGELGRRPEAGAAFEATYRIGMAAAGNVGAERITHIVFKAGALSGAEMKPRNPLPAVGGTPPETLAEARLFAPHRFRTERLRAITADDYAHLAQRHPKVQRAAAVLRWTGNSFEALVAIDQRDRSEAEPSLLTEIANQLSLRRRIGHTVRTVSARLISLHINLTVCVLPHFLRGHVEAAVLDILSNRRLADGRLGAFHPDNLSFGQAIYLSPIVAMVQAVPGVESVTVNHLERLFDGPGGEIARGSLPIGPLEIARLDNDPSLPENGRLVLDMRGGR